MSARSDDADERRTDGSVLLGNSDLRMTTDFLTGVRFASVGIPQGATILAAYVQFTAAQNNGGDSPSIDIGIEASDDAATFAGTTSEISTRVLDPTPPRELGARHLDLQRRGTGAANERSHVLDPARS